MPSRAVAAELLIATIAVLAALGLRAALTPVLGDRLPFITAFGGVAITAFFCRWQISAVAAAALFIYGGIYMQSDPQALRVAGGSAYVFSTGLIILMSTLLRQERNRAQRLARELTEKSEQLENFIAVVAHELRTPLAAMQNTATVLSMAKPSEDVVQATVPILERQTSHMRHLVDDLIDIARVQRGELRLAREAVKIRTVLEEAVDMCRPFVTQKQQTLACDPCGGDWTVIGDHIRLVQMVVNLIHNAAKFTPPKGEITVKAVPSNGTVDLVVEDQGRGLEASALDRLFRPFGKRWDDGVYSDTGLGIGLSIVKHLAELHGGSITAENRSGARGAKFSIRLPLAQ